MNSTAGHREFILSGLRGGGRLQQQWVNANLRYIGVGFSWGSNHSFGTAWTLWQMPSMGASPQPVAAREQEAPRTATTRTQSASGGMAANANRNAWEMLSVSYMWESGEDPRDGLVFGGGIYRSPFAFTAIGLETRVAFFFGETIRHLDFKSISAAPTLGLVFPIGDAGRVFANCLFELGFGPRTRGSPPPGFIGGITGENSALWATPGLDVGLEFGRRWTLNVKYRHVWFRDGNINSVGLGIGRRR